MILYYPYKNISYGLTLVGGLPFSNSICNGITKTTKKIDDEFPYQIKWYSQENLHTTFLPILRSLNRKSPPLCQNDFSENIVVVLDELLLVLGRIYPFTITFCNLQVTKDNFIIANVDSGSIIKKQLLDFVVKYPRLVNSKMDQDLHMTLGYLDSTKQRGMDEEQKIIEFIASLPSLNIIEQINKLWLVHYSSRTLDHIVRKIEIPLGKEKVIPDILLSLGISK